MRLFHLLKKWGPLRIAAVMFGLLALFVLIVEKPGSSSIDKVRESYPLLFPRLDLVEVTHLRLTFPGDTPAIALRKSGEGWLADEVLADQEKVQRLAGTASTIPPT
ncbi:MAG: hypothetical protein V1760_01765, partial [Candidatus Peregrinibacteria bacterium]